MNHNQIHDGGIEDPTIAFTINATTCRTLTQEINETLLKTQQYPRESKHYLHVGKLYLCQGKPEEAIDILEQALTNVPSSYDQLLIQQQLDVAKIQDERRVDLICKCPYEIVFNIISFLDQVTVVECLDVARTWRQKLLNHAPVWKLFALEEGVCKPRKLAQLLKAISKDIKVLYLQAPPEKLKRYLSTTVLKKNDFSNLQGLCISDENSENLINPELKLIKSLFDALNQISPTLTHLDISLTSNKFAILSPIRILICCPRLKTLRIDSYSFKEKTESRFSSMSEEQPPQREYHGAFTSLSKLEILYRNQHSTYIHLSRLLPLVDDILPCTPNLASLSLYHTGYNLNNRDILTALGDKCPKLKHIKTGSMDRGVTNYDRKQQLKRFLAGDRDDNKKPNNVNATDGVLQTVALHSIHSLTPLFSRLEKSTDSLLLLSLSLSHYGRDYGTVDDWQSLTNFTFSHLVSLTFANAFPRFYTHLLPSILQNLPMLEILLLGHTTLGKVRNYREEIEEEDMPNRLIEAITQRPKLNQLGFYRCNIRSDFKPFFEKILEYYGDIAQQVRELGIRSTMTETTGLTSLRFFYCDGFSAAALRHITRIKGLKHLVLNIRSTMGNVSGVSSITANETNEFTQHLSLSSGGKGSLPLLSKLELHGMELSDQAIHNIITCKSIKALNVERTYGYSKESEKLLNNYIENLK